MSEIDRDIQDGRQAGFELRLTAAAFAKARQSATDQIVSLHPEAAAVRERLVCLLQIIDGVEAELMRQVQAGVYAETAIEQEA